MNLSLSMMLSSFNVGYCSVAVGSASRCLRGSACQVVSVRRWCYSTPKYQGSRKIKCLTRSQRLRWKQRSGRSTVDRRHDSWSSARWAVDLARRAMEHGGGQRRPDLGGRRARGRTEEPPGMDLPPRASGFVARRQGSESPASRGCPGDHYRSRLWAT
jgi:hypothetical protein